MPQASEAARAQAEKYFGDPIDDAGPQRFLEEHGFICDHRWIYSKPNTYWKDLSDKERFAINFLCDEWDFGGWEQPK